MGYRFADLQTKDFNTMSGVADESYGMKQAVQLMNTNYYSDLFFITVTGH